MDLDDNTQFRGMNMAQRAVFEAVSDILNRWLKGLTDEAVKIEKEQDVDSAHEQAFWIVYFALIEQASLLASFAQPLYDKEDAVRKLTIDYRRTLERHFAEREKDG